ncbi:MAG: haloacid dehalogenase [Acidimicrobiia bacterium]|nr:haloacid dehalogenase [Acidimicrobiia bacterium]MYF84675.1 haloacid dehalogenase [Acidimicrobiia bacterium]
MSKLDLSSIEKVARAELGPKFAAREVAIANGRQVIRFSAKAIRAGHRGELERAGAMLAEAGELLAESTAAVADHPDIKIGILNDAAKEYAEAHLFLALARGDELPTAAELGTRMAPYLNGLGEAVGELRRRLLDQLRGEDFAEAERLLEIMDEVVDLLASLDYPDGMTGGLRRTTDVARSLTERSRADLTSALVADRIRQDIAALSDRREPD